MVKEETGNQSPAGAWMAVCCLAAAALISYSNSFQGTFVYDDTHNILGNRVIQKIWPPWAPFFPAEGTGHAGRPVAQFLVAVNYAISGYRVWSYHVLSLLIHILAGITLFGLIRRTLLLEKMKRRFGADSTALAFLASLLWIVHPLHSQPVNYITQRAESFMGLCLVATLYFALRGWSSSRQRAWHLLAVFVFFIGVGTKEVIVVAPFLVFLFDVVFVHQQASRVLRESRALYTGLVCGLLFQGLLIAFGGTVKVMGHSFPHTKLQFLLTQPEVIGHYIRLVFWPDALSFIYYWPVAPAGRAMMFVAPLLPLIAGTAWALWRRHPLGFLGAWFFLILSPSSTIAPVREIINEYRMYLPSAAWIALAVIGGYWVAARALEKWPSMARMVKILGAACVLLAASRLAALTYQHNPVYRSDSALWSDTITQSPLNSIAYTNLGLALVQEGRWQEAMVVNRRALFLSPANSDAHINLANALCQVGKYEEAARHYREAARINPGLVVAAHYNIGLVLAREKKFAGAIEQFEQALALYPSHVKARLNLGNVYVLAGHIPEGVRQYQEVLRLDPDYTDAHVNLAGALLQAGDRAGAMAHLETALKLSPDNPAALNLARSQGGT